MSLLQRIKKLEERANADKIGDINLYDQDGDKVEEAQVVRMPMIGSDGEALLYDGTKKPISYGDGKILLSFPGGASDGNLRLRAVGGIHLVFPPGFSEADFERR